eukprot:580018-Alexandrium_andersonii.AAC.1
MLSRTRVTSMLQDPHLCNHARSSARSDMRHASWSKPPPRTCRRRRRRRRGSNTDAAHACEQDTDVALRCAAPQKSGEGPLRRMV